MQVVEAFLPSAIQIGKISVMNVCLSVCQCVSSDYNFRTTESRNLILTAHNP